MPPVASGVRSLRPPNKSDITLIAHSQGQPRSLESARWPARARARQLITERGMLTVMVAARITPGPVSAWRRLARGCRAAGEAVVFSVREDLGGGVGRDGVVEPEVQLSG